MCGIYWIFDIFVLNRVRDDNRERRNENLINSGWPVWKIYGISVVHATIVKQQKAPIRNQNQQQQQKTKMSINKCDKIVEKSIINWIFVVILLSQQSPYIHAEPESEPIPLVRLPSNTLLKYTAYKDVSILHFIVPSDTRTAFFNFKAYEETKSAFCKYCTVVLLCPLSCIQCLDLKWWLLSFLLLRFVFAVRQCKPRDVTLHLKSGSYPVISPENITFPKHFLHADQR